MKNIIVVLILIICNLVFASEVLVTVDGKAITSLDVDKRIQALKLVNPTFQADQYVKNGVLNKLINEELFTNEARRLKIKVSYDEVVEHFKQMAYSSGFNQEKLNLLLNNDSLFTQIKNQVLWHKLVSIVLLHKVKVSDAEIREEQKVRKGVTKEVTFKNISFYSYDANNLSQLKIEAQSCENLDNLAKRYSFPIPQKNTILYDDLNSQLQLVINSLQENRLSDVIEIGGQKQLIMVCNKVVHNNPIDTKKIKEELMEKKIDAEAQKYLAELKKRIYIEYMN